MIQNPVVASCELLQAPRALSESCLEGVSSITPDGQKRIEADVGLLSLEIVHQNIIPIAGAQEGV